MLTRLQPGLPEPVSHFGKHARIETISRYQCRYICGRS